ncbi:ROK family protein [Symbiobacterium terraclitae]|uniref:ROK family protein n=1 Tax=Symbiobacterium terraclitae TaxID=557451 RepID=UPI0035B56E6C
MNAVVYLGIDIGGTGIKAAIVDARGNILQHGETPTCASEGAAGVLERVRRLGSSLIERAGTQVVACGVGSAGRIDHRRGHVIFASENLPGWTGTDLGAELHRAFGLPVFVDNDVNAASLAEAWIGAARGASDFLMLTLGTGVGGAITLGGRLWRGARCGAGEVGHMALYPGGEPCPCGGVGCAERYVSAKALTRRANEALAEGRPFRGIRDVISAATSASGHRQAAARQGLERWTADLALFLMNLQMAFDPQLIVVGGGIVRLGYWWDRLVQTAARECRARSAAIRLRQARLGPDAGVVGAARLAMLARPLRRVYPPAAGGSARDGSVVRPAGAFE